MSYRYLLCPWLAGIILSGVVLACAGCAEPDYTYDARGAQKCVATCSAAGMEVTSWHPDMLGDGCCHCGPRVHP